VRKTHGVVHALGVRRLVASRTGIRTARRFGYSGDAARPSLIEKLFERFGSHLEAKGYTRAAARLVEPRSMPSQQA